MNDFANIISTAGQYCSLALAFALVWWSSRTFFIAGAAIYPLNGAIIYILVNKYSWTLFFSGLFSLLISILLAIVIEVLAMYPFSQAQSQRGRSGVSENGLLSTAIASFAVYLIIINIVQWSFGSQADAVSLRHSEIQDYRHWLFFGIPTGFYTNTTGLLRITLTWTCCFILIILLKSRVGIYLRAVKSNSMLFHQITGLGRALRIIAMAACGAMIGLSALIDVTTSRVSLDGGLALVLGAMSVMILGTQSQRLIIIPIISIILSTLVCSLQSMGLSIWVTPISVTILLIALLLNPAKLLYDVRRIEENHEI